MYLTAQHVRSARLRRSGINAFLYHHGAAQPSGADWNPSFAAVETDPGTLVGEVVEVVPGGNDVVSFLDVVAPDNTPKERLLTCIGDAGEALRFERQQDVSTFDRVLVRFAAPHVPEGDRRAEFHALRDKLVALLARPKPPQWKGLAPLRVRANRSAKGWAYTLDDDAQERIRAVLGGAWRAPGAVLSDEVKHDFEALSGDLLPQVLPELVGLSADAALALGGVRVEGSDGEVLAVWPEDRTVGSGYCLHCHQHNALLTAPAGGFRCSNCGHVQTEDGLWVGAIT